MRRPLVFITVFYIYGIAAAELFSYFPLTTTAITILIITIICGINISSGNPLIFPILTMLISISVGFTFMLCASRLPADDISHFAIGDKATIAGTVDEPVTRYTQRVVANLNASTIQNGNKEKPVSGRIRLTVYDPETEIDYGDAIRFTGRLKKIRGFKNPGMFDYAAYVSRKGIRASVSTGKKEGIEKVSERGNPVFKTIYGWRNKIRLSIIHGLSDQSSAVLQAMIIGTTGDISPELRDKFTAAGVTHILSISGSHLGFVTFLIFFITRHLLTHLPYRILLGLTLHAAPSKIAAIITIPPVIFYSVLSGGEVATIRSMIMAIIFLSAILIERDDDSISTLAAAALLVLIWDPQGLFDISFQLSYTAVLSMIMTVRMFNSMSNKREASPVQRKWRQKFLLFIMLTVSATASTTLITAYYFNQISWVGLLSNMILIPYAGFTIVPIGLLTSCLGLIQKADTIPLSIFNELIMNIFLKMVDIFASFPFSVIHTPAPDMILIFFCYLFLISLFSLKKRWAKILSLISLFFIAAIISCVFFSRPDSQTMSITFLDVGQGDSALIEFPDRQIMVIDGGGTISDTFDIGRTVVAPYLWNRGIRSIDYIVLSHPQRDHAGGLKYLVDNFHVNEVWTNGMTSPATYLFDRSIHDKGIRHLKVNKNMETKIIGGCSIQILNPPAQIAASHASNSRLINDLSVVMQIKCKDNSVLFTGDIEKRQIREIAEGFSSLRSSIIKVPHHGARDSVDNNFISSVMPDIAVISAGYKNSYRHPSPEAISSYSKVGSDIYRTDLDGAIIVKTRNGKNEVITYKDTLLKKAYRGSMKSILGSELINLKMVMEGCCNGGL